LFALAIPLALIAGDAPKLRSNLQQTICSESRRKFALRYLELKRLVPEQQLLNDLLRIKLPTAPELHDAYHIELLQVCTASQTQCTR